MFPPRGGELQIPDGDVEPDPNQEWVERAFREIYWRARRSPAAEDDLPGLKELLIKAWIDDQALMRSDTAGWYEDVRYHDLEVPSG